VTASDPAASPEPGGIEKPPRRRRPAGCDRWLERVNAGPSALPSERKYDVSRRSGGRQHVEEAPERRLLAG